MVIKIEESLNFAVKIKLYGIFEIVEQVISVYFDHCVDFPCSINGF
jgi:hypothetical protein